MTGTDEEQHNRWWLVLAAALAVFMASVDLSLVTVALPVIQGDLGLQTSTAEWVAPACCSHSYPCSAGSVVALPHLGSTPLSRASSSPSETPRRNTHA